MNGTIAIFVGAHGLFIAGLVFRDVVRGVLNV